MKHLSFFLIATISLALIAFAPLGVSIPLAAVEARSATLQNPTVRIEPIESVVDASETFTITVMIDEANDLAGFEFVLFFVATTVTVDDVTLGDFLGSTGRPAYPLDPIIDNQAGRASFGAWTRGSAPGPDGTGELVSIRLTAQGAGISPLDLQNVMVLDTAVGSQDVTIEDGTVVVGGASSQKIYLPLVLKGW